MLTLQQIKADPRFIVERLAVKGFDGEKPVNRVLALDDIRRGLQLKNDNAAAELKRMADSIGRAMKEGRREDAEAAKASVAVLKEEQKAIAEELARTEEAITAELLNIPNIPCGGVPKERLPPTMWWKPPEAICPTSAPTRFRTGIWPKSTV